MILIKLQKPCCPVCDLPVFLTVDKQELLQRVAPIANTPHFRYDLDVPTTPVAGTQVTPRNKNGTIDVMCFNGHRWETGMQEVPYEQGTDPIVIKSPTYREVVEASKDMLPVPELDPERFRKRIEAEIVENDTHHKLMDAGFATEETPPGALSYHEKTALFHEQRLKQGAELWTGKDIPYRGSITEQVEGLEIHKLMVLSTSHIAKAVDEGFYELMGEDSAREVASGAYLEKTSGGWLIIIGEEDRGEDGARFSPSVMACVAFARKHGCTHLRIDSDGHTMKDLPTYNW